MATLFRPALLVVDMQEDFCPPNGALAVAQGRDVAPTINRLLEMPAFVIRIATKDWHPPGHISFAANHQDKQPFVDSVHIVNPDNPHESEESRLWPVHCVQGTPGAELIPELALGRIDHVLEKGQDPRVEMYSPFYAPFTSPRVADSGLAGLLRDNGVTDVYVVGLAADYCVRSAAVDAAREGFRTFLVDEGTRPVDAAQWPTCRKTIEDAGVRVVGMDGDEVARLMSS